MTINGTLLLKNNLTNINPESHSFAGIFPCHQGHFLTVEELYLMNNIFRFLVKPEACKTVILRHQEWTPEECSFTILSRKMASVVGTQIDLTSDPTKDSSDRTAKR